MLRTRLRPAGKLTVALYCSLCLVPGRSANSADPQQTATLAASISSPDARIPLELAESVPAPINLRLVADRQTPPKTANSSGNKTLQVETLTRGTSSSKVRDAAAAALPLDKLAPGPRQRAADVLREVGYFRRVPTTVVEVEAAAYQFFVAHPDVAVSIWRAMEISKLEMWQTGPFEYEGDAGDGTLGVVEVLYRGPNQTLAICEGQYQNPLLQKPIKARSLVMVETSFTRDAEGICVITHRADLFVSFPSQTVETAAKVLSPVTGPMIDRNFTEVSLFLRMMSLAMQRRPGWVDQIAGKLEGVPEIRRTQLVELTEQVNAAYQEQRDGLRASGTRAVASPAATVPQPRGGGVPGTVTIPRIGTAPAAVPRR